MGRWLSVLFRGLALIALALSLAQVSGAAQTAPDPGLEKHRPLFSFRDPALTAKLERTLRKQPGWGRLLRQRRLAVAVVDLSGGQPRFASVNGNVMMYAASLPKIAILLAAYQSFEDDSLAETPEVHRDLADMIRTSDNPAATRMIDRIGMAKIERVLRDPRYGLYDEKRGGGLWVGKRYASDGPRLGDPMFNLSHGATADQVARFYYLLATGRLVSPQRSAQMLKDLSSPGISHKFVASLKDRAPDARLYRKSGTWKQWHSDSVLVKGKRWRHYILVALVQSPRGAKIIGSMVPVVEGVIYPADTSRGGALEDTAAAPSSG
ncbi:MAG: serine hydrolase [Gammaproteobacteria bacterium]|nr:serine hydrolase [Gammaproteobacteria bacterium]